MCRPPACVDVASALLQRCVLGVLLIGLFGPASAWAGEVSGWASSQHSAARLIDAGPHRDGTSDGRLVGIEIRLDPSFITYWRSPGEAGVPPVFDFAASDNLRAAQVLYPAPRRFDEDGLAAFGYDAVVIFPVLAEAKDPLRPLTLDVRLDYAVCARLCLPATANLRLRLGDAASAEAEAVEAALRTIPEPRRLGQAGAIRIDAITTASEGSLVRVTTPDGTGTLFAEAPDPWFVAAGPARDLGHGSLSFGLAVPDRPAGPVPHAPLRLTLVGRDAAIEVSVPLDEALARP